MPLTLNLGPFALQAAVLVTLVALWAGWSVAARVAGRRGLAVSAPLALVLGAGLLAARAGFVWQHQAAYFAAPGSILDVRDGGWAPLAGVAAATLLASALALRRRALALPLAVAIASSVSLWVAGDRALQALQAPAPEFPDVPVFRLDGSPASLAAYKGQPVVLNLWATWCPPCLREMPVLQQAQASRPDVQFVFLNQGEDAARVARYMARHGLRLQSVLLDPSSAAGRWLSGRALPTTLFFDRQGRLVDTRIGELSRATLEQRLQTLTR